MQEGTEEQYVIKSPGGFAQADFHNLRPSLYVSVMQTHLAEPTFKLIICLQTGFLLLLKQSNLSNLILIIKSKRDEEFKEKPFL